MKSKAGGTLIGILVALVAVVVGLFLDGGHLSQVLQPTAALIVLGGTAGAVLVQFPLALVRQALLAFMRDARSHDTDFTARNEQILRFATQARQRGILSLDAELPSVDDPFFRRALMLAVDGLRAPEIRELMEMELDRLEEDDDRLAQVWDAAGGFAPTLGILGAVIGLIQVMQRLDSIPDVGRGIAVAFVATLYGVGSANLLFLPVAGKLRLRAQMCARLRESTLEGVLAIAAGVNGRLLRERLGAMPVPETQPAVRLVARR